MIQCFCGGKWGVFEEGESALKKCPRRQREQTNNEMNFSVAKWGELSAQSTGGSSSAGPFFDGSEKKGNVTKAGDRRSIVIKLPTRKKLDNGNRERRKKETPNSSIAKSELVKLCFAA